MKLRNLILAGVTALSLLPMAASAQGYGWQDHYDPPPPPPPQPAWGGGEYGPTRPDGGLMAREDHLRDWMARGSQEGWLTGWQAQRAWSAYHAICAETFRQDGYSFNGGDINRRLDHLANFVRRAHDAAAWD